MSPEWKDIKEWATDELQARREENDSPEKTIEDTQFMRGQIDVLIRLLDKGSEPKGASL